MHCLPIQWSPLLPKISIQKTTPPNEHRVRVMKETPLSAPAPLARPAPPKLDKQPPAHPATAPAADVPPFSSKNLIVMVRVMKETPLSAPAPLARPAPPKPDKQPPAHPVKLLDWGEDGFAAEAETAALRTSFKQEVAVCHKLGHPNVTKFVGASMGTTDLKIPHNNSNSGARTNLPARACCVVVEYLAGGTLKQYLIKNSRRKLTYKLVVRLALDMSREY